ncbi:MAG TPA: MarR family transcriptional regulator [Pedomonas sp.]|uniref:MarR family winged helix-turn-helix transcriptional regulator n=1 Tax=Pedomonas sp. TaxID=2976421 RepID=UPI002F42C8A8
MTADETRFTSSLAPLSRLWKRAIGIVVTPFGLTEPMTAPLIRIHRTGGMTQAALAECLGIGGPSLVPVLNRLEALGLIERRLDTDDKRVNRIHLTAAGVDLAMRIETAIEALRKMALADVSDEQVSACLEVFAHMERALDQFIASPSPVTGSGPARG